MARAYLRLDPGFFDRKAIDQKYPPGAIAALIGALCHAEHQPQRGRFRDERVLRALLGPHAKWISFLIEKRDLVRVRGVLYVDGWDEWQEGDWKVGERVKRIRERHGDQVEGPTPGAQRTANWRLRTKVFERDSFTCRYCGRDDYPREWLILEHVDPNGPTDETNLVTACRSCNKLKGGRTPEQAGMMLRDASPRDSVTHGRDASPNESRDASADSSRRQSVIDSGSGSGKRIEGSLPTGSERARRNGTGPTLSKRELEAWSSFGPEWDGVKAAWIARGLRLPPAGDPVEGDEQTQRGILYQVLDARPTDLVRWIAEAPGKSSSDVVRHVLERWHAVRTEAGTDDVPDAWTGPSRGEAAESLASILERL